MATTMFELRVPSIYKSEWSHERQGTKVFSTRNRTRRPPSNYSRQRSPNIVHCMSCKIGENLKIRDSKSTKGAPSTLNSATSSGVARVPSS